MKLNRSKNSEVTCSSCGAQTARNVKRPQLVGKGANLVMVFNVPMYSCRNCGHTHFTAEVARMLDQIRLNPRKYAQTRAISVAEFA